MKNKILLTFLVMSNLIIFVISCNNEEDSYKDIEVTIIRTFNTTLQTGEDAFGIDKNVRQANVRYTVENTGAETVHGWKIYFNVFMENGPQLEAKGYVASTLEPGEISSEKLASGYIQVSSGNAQGAKLKFIEVN